MKNILTVLTIYAMLSSGVSAQTKLTLDECYTKSAKIIRSLNKKNTLPRAKIIMSVMFGRATFLRLQSADKQHINPM